MQSSRAKDAMVEATKKKLTHEDLLLFPDDGKRHELIDGEHFVTSSPRRGHQWVVRNLFRTLDAVVLEAGLGELYFAPLDVIFSDIDVVEPDLLFVRTGREAILQDWVRGAPDLVAEVVSPSTRARDETLKRDLYERFAVEEYWVVDPEAETVKVYRLDGGSYGRPKLLSAREGDTLVSPLMPGLEAPLVGIFGDG